ncbi:3-hydroxybutyryl-CoA dehydratase [Desulfotomaculum arcticum]|uniref:3-hydroxybutyryl-CoA dehydratase n=1 Tax=Desulfotruncus arcticus DSM 17038 TaxID=1121424 RepID=A0A1I2YG58_9FIRM|nr:MaoC family dehydratase [Desulfotruncus arcticus]SFH24575.1 3-hydroxybutyryl-CoA dehydratase [Desulfotomaculum arcticum] [Desulfotruncus arcticus DSM 17038]
MKVKTIDDVYVGQKEEFSKTISENDVYLFAGITADYAPHHINEEFAKTTVYGRRLVHGMLTASLPSACTSKIVSPGAVSMGHEFRFLKPVFIGDTITAIAEVIEINQEKKRVKIRTYCTNQNGDLVLDGTTLQYMKV